MSTPDLLDQEDDICAGKFHFLCCMSEEQFLLQADYVQNMTVRDRRRFFRDNCIKCGVRPMPTPDHPPDQPGNPPPIPEDNDPGSCGPDLVAHACSPLAKMAMWTLNTLADQLLDDGNLKDYIAMAYTAYNTLCATPDQFADAIDKLCDAWNHLYEHYGEMPGLVQTALDQLKDSEIGTAINKCCRTGKSATNNNVRQPTGGASGREPLVVQRPVLRPVLRPVPSQVAAPAVSSSFARQSGRVLFKNGFGY